MRNAAIKARIILSALIIVQLILCTTLQADENLNQTGRKSLKTSRTDGVIKIDGELKDSGWKNAASVSDFLENEPGENIAPLVETRALITYDDANVYVGFICYDNPAEIRASFCERDRTYNDDRVGFMVDTYGDAAWAYEFFVNPYGIQLDKLLSQEYGEDDTYDLIWESAGKITDSGYQVEMAIPFSSLRFPDKSEQVWKIEFWRNHPRDSRHKYGWANFDRNEPCWACQWAPLTGIRDVSPGKGITFMPSVIGFQSGTLDIPDTTQAIFDNYDPDGELSFDAKYSITSSITAEASVNPDFSQIEADAAQIDVNSTSALYYQERRPFFQEGSDLFRTIFDAVYSRMINDPLFAAKLIGRFNRTNIAFLSAYDENSPILVIHKEGSKSVTAYESLSNILRLRRTFGENSRVGLLLTDRRHKDGGSGTLMGIDGAFRLSKNINSFYQIIATHTEEPDHSILSEPIYDFVNYGLIEPKFDNDKYTPVLDGESFWGHAAFADIEYQSKNTYTYLSYLETSPTYRPPVGYRHKNSQRGPRYFGQYHFWVENSSILERVSPSISLGREWNFDNQKNYEFAQLSIETMFKAQTSNHSQYKRYSELYRNKWYDNQYQWHACLHSIFSNVFNVGGHINYGHELAYGAEVIGRQLDCGVWIDIKPIDRLLVETAFRYLRSDRLDKDWEEIQNDTALANNPAITKNLFKAYTVWTRTGLQLSRELSLRLVVEYDDYYKVWAIDPLITYRLNPFSVFYAGSSYDYVEYDMTKPPVTGWKLDNRQFFIKFRYLFQM